MDFPIRCSPPDLAITTPPVRHFFFSGQAYEAGIEDHELDGVRIRVYDRGKTLADCFRFRNKVGMNVFLEALKLYKDAGNTRPGLIMDFPCLRRSCSATVEEVP